MQHQIYNRLMSHWSSKEHWQNDKYELILEERLTTPIIPHHNILPILMLSYLPLRRPTWKTSLLWWEILSDSQSCRNVKMKIGTSQWIRCDVPEDWPCSSCGCYGCRHSSPCGNRGDESGVPSPRWQSAVPVALARVSQQRSPAGWQTSINQLIFSSVNKTGKMCHIISYCCINCVPVLACILVRHYDLPVPHCDARAYIVSSSCMYLSSPPPPSTSWSSFRIISFSNCRRLTKREKKVRQKNQMRGSTEEEINSASMIKVSLLLLCYVM